MEIPSGSEQLELFFFLFFFLAQTKGRRKKERERKRKGKEEEGKEKGKGKLELKLWQERKPPIFLSHSPFPPLPFSSFSFPFPSPFDLSVALKNAFFLREHFSIPIGLEICILKSPNHSVVRKLHCWLYCKKNWKKNQVLWIWRWEYWSGSSLNVPRSHRFRDEKPGCDFHFGYLQPF